MALILEFLFYLCPFLIICILYLFTCSAIISTIMNTLMDRYLIYLKFLKFLYSSKDFVKILDYF